MQSHKYHKFIAMLVFTIALVLIAFHSIATPIYNMDLVGICDTPGFARGVYASGGHAYIADHESGLRIIDVSDPTLPYETGFYDTDDYAYGVYVLGNYAYTISILLLCIKCYDIWHYEKSYAQHQRIA